MVATTTTKLLLINPNVTEAITDGFRAPVSSLNLPNVCIPSLRYICVLCSYHRQTEISYWTNPSTSSSPVLITDAETEESARQCLEPLLEIVSQYDGFLMVCYTRHPLLPLLQSKLGRKPVVGMFEASITTALHLVPVGSKFGVVTTASSYIQHLTVAVKSVLGITQGKDSVFAGVVASGITWEVLTQEPKEVAKWKMIDTVRKLVRGGDIGVVCLGGAILAGMADWV
jgi:Asp/Glu/hydantoin racemase